MLLTDLQSKLEAAQSDLEQEKLLFKTRKSELVRIEDSLVEKREVIRHIEEAIDTFKLTNIDLSIDDMRTSDIESFRARLPEVEAKYSGTTIFEISDPLIEWCKANREVLSAHHNCHVAISMREGIIISTSDKADFTLRIARMSEVQREGVYFVHTSDLKV